MKKRIRSIYALLFVATLMSGCLDYDDLRENPNDPTSVPPSLLFTQVSPGVAESFLSIYNKAQYHFGIGTDNISNVDLRDDFNGNFDFYGDIRNANKMIEEAEKVNAQEYLILAKFIKARAYLEMSRRMGDIPLSESENALEIPQPRYDSQKSVYIQCLDWLDEANNELGVFIANNQAYTVEGDLFYGGDLGQWQKAINAYTLRILVSLSKRVGDADLRVQNRFSNIVGNPDKYPLFTSNLDNAVMHYRDADGFRQDYNPNIAVERNRQMYASTYIDILKDRNDPRLMMVADPTRDALEANPDEAAVRADFNSYAGANITDPGIVNSAKRNDGDFSPPNFDRYWNFVGQPGVFLSYWEQELNIAEAAHRGWISNNAQDHYINGIVASMSFYGVDEGDIIDYLNNEQPYITGTAGLDRILMQKYIALAENSGDEGYFTWRRTGIPTFIFDVDINNVDSYPVRWRYPESENVNNNANYRSALQSQFGGQIDDIYHELWITKD